MSAREPDAPGPAPAREAPVTDTDPSDRPAPASSPEFDSGEEGFWSAYWERFRRQQVDDPVEERREGMWDRFRRQDVDDPVGRK